MTCCSTNSFRPTRFCGSWWEHVSVGLEVIFDNRCPFINCLFYARQPQQPKQPFNCKPLLNRERFFYISSIHPSRFSNPPHRHTGCGGYLGYSGDSLAFAHIQNTDPRLLLVSRRCVHLEQIEWFQLMWFSGLQVGRYSG